ncbi:hypothetical protein D3C74_375090 [compost metagenome]
MPRLGTPVFLVQQVTGHIERDIHGVAQRHYNIERHSNGFGDLNVGDDRCHADPGIQAFFAKKPVAEQIETKVDNYEQNSPQQIKHESVTPPSFGYAGWLRTAAFSF